MKEVARLHTLKL